MAYKIPSIKFAEQRDEILRHFDMGYAMVPPKLEDISDQRYRMSVRQGIIEYISDKINEGYFTITEEDVLRHAASDEAFDLQEAREKLKPDEDRWRKDTLREVMSHLEKTFSKKAA
jgi:hypothetical protein